MDFDKGEGAKNRIQYMNGSDVMQGYTELDADGKPVGNEQDIAIGTDWTTVCFEGKNGEYHKIQIKTVPADGKTVSFELKEVPVGVILPEIVLNGLLNAGGEINNNDMIQSHVAISGTGDCRAYEKVKGNADSETLTIIQLQGTALNKTVNKNLMELGDIFEYHINYTNNSNE